MGGVDESCVGGVVGGGGWGRHLFTGEVLLQRRCIALLGCCLFAGVARGRTVAGAAGSALGAPCCVPWLAGWRPHMPHCCPPNWHLLRLLGPDRMRRAMTRMRRTRTRMRMMMMRRRRCALNFCPVSA